MYSFLFSLSILVFPATACEGPCIVDVTKVRGSLLSTRPIFLISCTLGVCRQLHYSYPNRLFRRSRDILISGLCADMLNPDRLGYQDIKAHPTFARLGVIIHLEADITTPESVQPWRI